MGRKYGWGWAFRQVINPPKRRAFNSNDAFLRKVRNTRRKNERKFKQVKAWAKRNGWRHP